MSTSRSDSVYEKWKESTEKFDYFILGVIGALCAYVSQNFKPEQIGINPGTLDLLGLLILVLGAIFGFRRIESANAFTLLNHKILYANEMRGELVSVMQNGPRINTQTGQTYSPDYAEKEITKLNSQIEQLEPQLRSAQDRAKRHYHMRNALTLTGFLLLLLAKLYSAYV